MMAEGGYLEGILEFNAVTKEYDRYKKKENNHDDDSRVNNQANRIEAAFSESMNEKKDSVVNRLTEDPEAFQTIADAKKVVCESNRPRRDLECASSELKAVEEAHDKLVAEKNELILTLESKTSMAKVI